MNKLFLVIILGISLHAHGSAGSKCTVLMGMFNVQNFVRPDPKSKNDSMPVDKKDVVDKTKNLARAISTLNADFLGFAEVGSKEHLVNLVKEPSLKVKGYDSIAVSDDVDGDIGKPDPNRRVIKVGFINKLKVLREPVSHVFWNKNDVLWAQSTTRPILEVVLELPNGEPVTVFVNHWPSQLHGQWSVLRRYQAGVFLASRKAEILGKDPNANIVAMGDFNTQPWSPEMQAGLGMSWLGKADDLSSGLYNLNHSLGTYFDEISDFKLKYPEATGEQWAKFYGALGKKYGTYFYGEEAVWMNFAAEIETFRNKHPVPTDEEVSVFYQTLAKRYVAHYAEKPQNGWDTFDQIMVSKNMLKYVKKGSYGPVHRPPFVDKNGHPNQFDNKNNMGLSDHIPVTVEFEF